jgi:uncharacterized membrane protein YdbT with pleckstrin-like domain
VLAAEILSEGVMTLAVIVLITIMIFLPPPFGNPLWAIGYLLLALPAGSLLRDVLAWANHKHVVTNQRVIHVVGVLSKEITDSSLEKVNDVRLEQSFWGRVLGYGTVEILTASELGASKFTTIANPIQFKTAMLNAKHRLGYEDEGARAAGQRGGVFEWQPAPNEHTAARPAGTQVVRGSLLEQMQAKNNEAVTKGSAASDVPALLRQLDELRQAGVLTEAEFQNKKAQLLDRL